MLVRWYVNMSTIDQKQKETIQKIKERIEETVSKVKYDFSYSEEKFKEWQDIINHRLHPIKFNITVSKGDKNNGDSR